MSYALALPAESEPNLAPSEPLKQYLDAEGKPFPLFEEWLKTKCQELEQLNSAEWEELALLWAYLNLMIEGKNMLRKKHRGWGWDVVPMPESTTANIRGQNKLGFYFRVLQSKWAASRTKIDAIAGDDSDESVASAKSADQWYAAVSPIVYSEKFRQQESVAAPVHGTYARYHYYDESAEDGGYGYKPVTEQQPFRTEASAECRECGFVGTPEEFGIVGGSGTPVPGSDEPAMAGGMGLAGGGQAPMGVAGGQQASGRFDSDRAALPQGMAEQGGLNGNGASFGNRSNNGRVDDLGVQPPQGAIGPEGFAPGDLQGSLDPAAMGGGQAGPYAGAGQGFCPGPVFGDDGSQYICGSSDVAVTPAKEELIEVVTGVQQYKLGNLKMLSVPYSQIRHEISCSFEESPWGRWKRRIRTEELKQKWPKLKIPSATDAKKRDPGLAYEEAMRSSVATNSSSNSSVASRGKQHYSDLAMWWFAPCMYQDYVFPVDTSTVAGEKIPAGTKAVEAFPDGMYVAICDGIDAPLQVKNESHKKRWVTAPYHLRLFTGLGLGVQDSVEMQRQWNLILSLVFTQLRTAALAGWLYDKDAIEGDQVKKLSQPNMSVPVSLRNRPEGTRIEQLVYQMKPGQIPAHIPWYIEQLDSNMQTSMGALVNEGVPGMDSKTATGVQQMVGASQQHNAPEFSLKGDADKRSAELLFGLAQKHYVEPRYLPNRGKRGKQGGIWLSAADFANGQVRFEAVGDSWMPNTRGDKQEAIKSLLLVFGGIQGLLIAMQEMPEFVEQTAEAFQVDIQGDLFEPTMLLCRQRVDQIQELAPGYLPLLEEMTMLAEMDPLAFVDPANVDPMTGMPMPMDPLDALAMQIVEELTPPVELEEPAHPIAIKCLRDMFLDDEIKEADKLTRGCLKALIRKHVEAAAQEAQIMNAMAMMAAPPMEEEGGNPNQPQRSEKDKRNQQARGNMSGQKVPMNPKPQAQAMGM